MKKITILIITIFCSINFIFIDNVNASKTEREVCEDVYKGIPNNTKQVDWCVNNNYWAELLDINNEGGIFNINFSKNYTYIFCLLLLLLIVYIIFYKFQFKPMSYRKEDFNFTKNYYQKHNYIELDSNDNKQDNQIKKLQKLHNIPILNEYIDIYSTFFIKENNKQIIFFLRHWSKLATNGQVPFEFQTLAYKLNKNIPDFFLLYNSNYMKTDLVKNEEFNNKYSLCFYWDNKQEVSYLFSNNKIIDFFNNTPKIFSKLHASNNYLVLELNISHKEMYKQGYETYMENTYNEWIKFFKKVIDLFE